MISVNAPRAAFTSNAVSAEREFGEITDKSGVSAEWRCVEGQQIDTLSLHARYADLLVVGQADPDDPECVSRGLADHLALASVRPVLVKPAGGVIGENVFVAWNAKREAVRAISDAMPLLESANRVSVVTINASSDDPENAGIPAADVAAELLEWTNTRVDAKFQRISDVVLMDSFPRNVAGKTLKRELREQFRQS